jgi:hypothetical protein
VCELFGVFHVQTVLTFSDTARNPLTTFMSGRYQVSKVPLRGEPPWRYRGVWPPRVSSLGVAAQRAE